MKLENTIIDVIDEPSGLVITTNGCIAIAFRLFQPESYSLHLTDIDDRNQKYYQAFKNLPDGSYIHKQDVYLKRKYYVENIPDNFLARAEYEHFQGREYLEHSCVIIYTLSNLESLSSQYIANPYSFRKNLHLKDKNRLSDFLEAVSASTTIIDSMRDTKTQPMSGRELKEYIKLYVNFFPASPMDRDVHFEGDITIDSLKARYYTVCDEEYLPDTTISTNVVASTLQASNSTLYMTELEKLGLHLNYNHVINQTIYIEGDRILREELSSREAQYRTNKGWDTLLEKKSEELTAMLNEVVEEKQILCRTNFSLMVFSENSEDMEIAEKKVEEWLTLSDFKFYKPSFEHLCNIHLSTVPGQEAVLDKQFLFLTTMSIALCLWVHYTSYKSDKDGVFFNDRIFQIPLKKDIWDADKKRIPARNGIVVASTGGGKSVLTLNILQQLIEQDYVAVVVEFGKSFEQLCKLYPQKSIHVDYDGKSPLGLNPFELNGNPLDDAKLEVLSEIVQRLWSQNLKEAEKITALTKIIRDYYANVYDGHSFPSFYQYVVDNFSGICKNNNIREEYFDISSFTLVCSDFLPGGRYESVCTSDGKYNFNDKSFIVFELTQIKRNVFLSSLIMTLIFDVIHDKILSDRNKRGIIIFDEYGETAQMKDEEKGISIHSSVAFCYQKIRKENGAIMTIIQTPDQLPDDEYTKSIIANTQLLYVLPTTDVVYKSVQEKFKMDNEAQINMMRSIKNNFSSRMPYSECFIRFQEQYSIVVRNELSREKFLAFQTDGEVWAEINSLSKNMTMEEAIKTYKKLHP